MARPKNLTNLQKFLIAGMQAAEQDAETIAQFLQKETGANKTKVLEYLQETKQPVPTESKTPFNAVMGRDRKKGVAVMTPGASQQADKAKKNLPSNPSRGSKGSIFRPLTGSHD